MAMNYPDINRIVSEARAGGRADQRAEQDKQTVENELFAKIRQAKVRFTEDLRALYQFMMDPAAPVHGKAVAVAALLYFISPLDVIPDVIPVLGYADDAAVIAAAVSYLSSQLASYRKRA